MVKLSLLFLVLLVTTTYAQIGPDGTGTVNGYTIGPGANLYGADLTVADLTGADLTGADLRFAYLSEAILSGAVLTGAELNGADLTGADLFDADLSGADLSGADLTDADLSAIRSGNITGTPTLPSGYQMVNGYIVGRFVNLTNADLTGADLTDAEIVAANLTGADLSNANLTGADLRGAILFGADLSNANLPSADLTYANLSSADLTYANLSFANLSGADLTGIKSGNITGTPTLPSGYQMVNGYIVGPNADLTGADLSGADLSGADLSNANLSHTDLSGADLNGADLSGAYMYRTIWSNVISQSDYDAVVAERDAALTAKASAEAERDARPTQVAYDTVVAEREAKLTLDEVKDLRAGSTMIAVENGTATLSMEVVQSDDLEIWTSGGTTDLQIPVDANSDTKFFRFKMTE